MFWLGSLVLYVAYVVAALSHRHRPISWQQFNDLDSIDAEIARRTGGD